MDAMLAEASPDPRVQLAAGFNDAGQALWNMALVATRPKPEGFYDPNNPAGRPMPVRPDPEPEPAEPEAAGADEAEDDAEEGEGAEEGEDAEPEEGAADEEEAVEDDEADSPQRRGLLNFGNTDLAFAGDQVYVGSHHGFNTYRVEVPASPQLVSSVVCPGGQGDVSVVGNLLIMSVEQTRGRLDCGLQGVAEPVSEQRFRGVRIFDIGDMRMPRQVAAVQTCRGSHTHTVVTDPDDAGNIYVYGSGSGAVRSGEELEGCSDESPAENPDTALFRIDVIRVPLASPEDSAVVSRPQVFRIPRRGPPGACGPAATTGRARSAPPRAAAATTSPRSPRSASRPGRARATASCSTSPTP